MFMSVSSNFETKAMIISSKIIPFILSTKIVSSSGGRSQVDHFLDALDNLSNNQLSHSVIPPKEMNDLIAHANKVLKTQYPNYEFVVSRVHDYYNLPFSTFACQGNILMFHISLYIKLINQESLHMYEIKSIPVPYHMNEELSDDTESKYTYTKN